MYGHFDLQPGPAARFRRWVDRHIVRIDLALVILVWSAMIVGVAVYVSR